MKLTAHLLLLSCLSLTACGGGSSGNDNKQQTATDQTPKGIITNSDDHLKIVGDDQLQTVNKQKVASIDIIGDKNIVVIKSNISELKIVGDENQIDLSEGVIISSCQITGDSNTLKKPNSTTVSCNIVGKNNKGFN